MTSTSIIRSIRLEPVSGPPVEAIVVSSGKPFVIGRQAGADAMLTDNTVSRRHAEIAHRADTWFVSDLQSYHGTFLNGVRLGPSESSPMHPGDMLRLGPWTFRVGGPPRGAHLLSTSDDTGSTVQRVHRVPAKDLSLRAEHRLELLINCAASITAATSEQQLAEAVLAALVSGTGFPRAAFIRRLSGGEAGSGTGQVEVVAIRGPETQAAASPPGDADGAAPPVGRPAPHAPHRIVPPVVSRSLIQAAADGQVVRLDEAGAPQYGQSVVQLGIQAAICAPVMVDSVAAAFLYLDARRSESHSGHAGAPVIESDAPAFCQAVARICALALANLSRHDLARRQKQLEDDLNAAREAQRLIMPKPAGRLGPFEYALRSKPGRFVAGDLFDLFPLQGGRVGVFLGDVSGKGIEAAMLMATAQAHLNASLQHNPDVAAAVAEVNRHVAPRVKDGRFITLWAGILDPAGRTLTFVDAGHGHCMIKRAGQPPQRLDSTGGLPVGISAEATYPNDTVSFGPGTRLILYSDGLVEQQSPGGEEFGLARAITALGESGTPGEDVQALFNALLTFATPPVQSGAKPMPPEKVSLSDDVTIASIHVGDG